MVDVHSFEPLLRKYLNKVNPGKILEYGPGRSTEIMLEECSAEITSVEHHHNWYRKTKAKYPIDLIYKPLIREDGRCERDCGYATAGFDNAPYDLIFIDGRRRVECVFVALQVLNEGGVIFLHDANRKNYRQVIDKYIDIIEEKDDTIVFR